MELLASRRFDLDRSSHLRRAEEERLESHLEREWIALLGHELRNPVGAISLGIETAKRGSVDAAEVTRNIEMMERQVSQITRLLDDFADVARLTGGRMSVERAPVDLQQVGFEAIETVRPLIRARRQDLAVALPPADTVRVHGDHARLVQVVVNLLANAAKYTQPGGRIALEVAPGLKKALIVIRDTGIGISNEAMPRIFDLFWQGSKRSGPDRGLGLGLALVRCLVLLHNGNVSASSAGENQGSEFRVELPYIG
jgi:signal transduction histidine kinase